LWFSETDEAAVKSVTETEIPGYPKRAGKVRDLYDLGDRLLMVATDRISAFDWVMPDGVPDKGRVLTQLSAWWFERLGVPNHLISTDVGDTGIALDTETREALRGRVMVVRKVDIIPFECVVRGYLAGSGWKEYQRSASVCGCPLPPGLRQAERITPIFTPATKAESGHDENVPFATMEREIGSDLAGRLRELSLDIYRTASRVAAASRPPGLILADTKFEFGLDRTTGDLLLADEVLTPDSSRYWDAESYAVGGSPPSFDKQFVRDWLESTGWDKASPPPALPREVEERTREKYIECYERLTGISFEWK
jgi:phosphoribosylaminoimidazole-succinocarboxamide synthase